MSCVPCEKDLELRRLIEQYAEALKTQAHTIGAHGLSEKDFYQSGLFRGAIERIRGQFSATMGEKRGFASRILNRLQDGDHIRGWESAGESNRHDYVVELNSGKMAAIELKGCLDGNNTNIFERPPHVQEFVIWSVCSNAGADPRRNVWSGVHTRLSAEIILRNQQVDGLIVWDWLCGTVARPCPKIASGSETTTVVGSFELPPPCLYLFPGTIPSPRNNPKPAPHASTGVEILSAFEAAFGCSPESIHSVQFEVAHQGAETVRTTSIRRNGVVVEKSRPTPLQRS